MRFKWKLAFVFTAGSLALLSAYILLPMLMMSPVQPVYAETSNYWIAVNPILSDSNLPMYTSTGQNWTLLYEALWIQGEKSGQPVENATVTIRVNSTLQNKAADLHLNTTSGIFGFNYTSLTADILTFNVTKLETADGDEYYLNVYDPETGRGALQSQLVTVWWDAIHVELAESDTTKIGATKILVNVTYQLLPKEGLTLPAWATYSGQTFLPKPVHGQNITINGVQAQETSTPGIYIAEVSNWFPTAYIHVAAAQQNWTTTHVGFSFTHTANLPVWAYISVFAGVTLTGAILFKVVMLKKSSNSGLSKRSNLQFFAGILLAVASAMSMYWTAVGIEGIIAGFDWTVLAVLGIVSSVTGLVGVIMIFRRKNQAIVIASVILPLVVNLVVVKAELDVYQLPTPWIALFGTFAVTALSGILIANSENQVAS